MNTILFQGDSITDANRDREGKVWERILGHGYVNLVAASLMCDHPGIRVLNTARNGDRICDLYGRWIEDTLNIDFDMLSILCGINDIGFALRMNRGADAEKFEYIYDRMIYEVKKEKPKAEIVLCEPFLFRLKPEEVQYGTDIIEDWDIWNGHMRERRDIVKRLSQKYNTIFVPSGEAFEAACEKAPASHWSVDGIHLTLAGNELLAREWLKAVEGRVW